MNSSISGLCCAVVLGWVVSCCTSELALAQTESGEQTVAVLDVARVFKECVAFNEQVKLLQAELKEQQEKIVAENEGKEADDASRDRNRSLAEMRMAMSERESELYLETYLEMQKLVRHIADEHDIRLVLRADNSLDFSPERIDAEAESESTATKPRRTDVLKRINSLVVYQDRLDLTTIVIAKMNASSNSKSTQRCESCGQVIRSSGKHTH